MALFTTDERKLIRFEDILDSKPNRAVNDWKLTNMEYTHVMLSSASLNRNLVISDKNFMELLINSNLNSCYLEGTFRILKYKNKEVLLKEGSEEFIIATKNCSIKKPVLKVGEVYTLRQRNCFKLNSYETAEADRNDLNLKWTFLGNFHVLQCDYKYVKDNKITERYRSNKYQILTNDKMLKMNELTEQIFVFLVNGKLVEFKRRQHFDLIECVGFDTNHADKENTLNKLNDLTTKYLVEKLKMNEDKNLVDFDFHIHFLSLKEIKNLALKSNHLFTEKVKKQLSK